MVSDIYTTGCSLEDGDVYALYLCYRSYMRAIKYKEDEGYRYIGCKYIDSRKINGYIYIDIELTFQGKYNG